MTATSIATVPFGSKGIRLEILHRETSKGETFTYRVADAGETNAEVGALLKPVKSIDGLASAGSFDRQTFEVKKVKERFTDGDGNGMLVETNAKYIQSNSVVEYEGRKIKLTLEFRPDANGRFSPSFKGNVLSGGQRGRVAADPIDEDEYC